MMGGQNQEGRTTVSWRACCEPRTVLGPLYQTHTGTRPQRGKEPISLTRPFYR